MKRKIALFVIIAVCFILQCTVFQVWDFSNISPNLLLVVTSAFGFMRGSKEGMWIGFFCGLLMDIFFGFHLGVYALIYMYIGLLNGFFQKWFFPDDIKMPLGLLAASDLLYGLSVYFILYLFRSKFDFGYYLKSIILPELIYTMVISIGLYLLLLKINQKIEEDEKRRAKKFD